VTPSQPETNPPEPAGSTANASFDRALTLIRFLRENCEWDARQTPHSLLPYLLEEAHEVADAVVRGDDDALVGELGDLLLNVAFQTLLAQERGAFDEEDVVRALEAKMRRRHPHLYGDGPAQDWETLKARERAEDRPRASILDGLTEGIEPLSYAQRIQERVAAVGFDWPSADGALAKVEEELNEVRAHLADAPSAELQEELGDLLFAVVNLTRLSGAHAMRALHRANEKFRARFAALEILAHERGIVLGEASLEQLDRLWEEIKRVGP
jgi:MazG family protein